MFCQIGLLQINAGLLNATKNLNHTVVSAGALGAFVQCCITNRLN